MSEAAAKEAACPAPLLRVQELTVSDATAKQTACHAPYSTAL